MKSIGTPAPSVSSRGFPNTPAKDLTQTIPRASGATSGKPWPPELVPPFGRPASGNCHIGIYWKFRPTFGPGSFRGQSLTRHKRVYGRFWCELGFFNVNLHNILVDRNNVPVESTSTKLQILVSRSRPFSSIRTFVQHVHCKMLGSLDVYFCHDVHRHWKLLATARVSEAMKYSTPTLRIHSPNLFPKSEWDLVIHGTVTQPPLRQLLNV